MYLIFDTETTGKIENWKAPVTDFKSFPRVVQLAWQRHDYKGKLIEAKNYIIRPDGFTIPYNAEKIHGISTERAIKQGVALEAVLNEFGKSLEDSDFVIGHNVEFDLKVLGAEYARAMRDDGLMKKHPLDTMQLSTEYCKLPGGRGKGFKFPTLSELSEKLFKEKVNNAHNASADVEATARCFFELIRINVIGIKELKTNDEYLKIFKESNPNPFQLIGLNVQPYHEMDAESDEETKVPAAEQKPSKKSKSTSVDLTDVPFVHLHNHTQFSILQSTSGIKRIVAMAAEMKMPAIALTDLGNMMGAFLFVQQCELNGIKAILGCELYVSEDHTVHQFTKDKPDKRFRQVLLAKNEDGYHNLSKLCSLGFTEGFYAGIPRVNKASIEAHKEHLMATTGGLDGEIAHLILNVGEKQAEEAFQYWHALFGEDFYVQLMRHGLEAEDRVNEVLMRFCKTHSVKYFAANDVYYPTKDDANAHDILLCVKDGELQNTPVGQGRGNRYGMPNHEYYFKSGDEMKALFSDLPEAISTISEIVDKVSEYKLNREILLPAFDIPADFESEDAYLKHLTYIGAEKKYGKLTDEIRARLDYELNVIAEMKFSGYFLIVQDFTTKARELGVWVGPGRGSAAGSAVAYATGIVNIDPIRYRLLFERFLNPERVTMPDIDIDFDDEGREKIIEYVVDKYGKNQVAQIMTYGTMAAKSSIRDVARVMDLPLSDADRIAKLVPDLKKFKEIFGPSEQELKKSFSNEELVNVKKLIEISESDTEEAKILNQARKLEGSVRNTGVHACGVIITPQDIREYVPVATAKDSDFLLTQFDNSVMENAGLLKMDFLGLKTLSIMRDAIALIRERHGVTIDPDLIPLDDAKTFELFQRGETNATFQFESPGMQKNLKQLKPTDIEDLIAMNALYRPGPLQFIDTYIKRKHGIEKTVYLHPLLEPIVGDTYGIMVYQEQIMKVAQELAGFTLGSADILRRAMGKKKMDVMQKQKQAFIEGCATYHQIEQSTAEEIFDTMVRFAEYGFNRSHSAAYTVLAFQTAYLKANYPSEYMAAVLTHNMADIKKVTFFMDECRRMNIPVLGPDVNESQRMFTVNKTGKIRFGMGAIKGVGEGAVDEIVAERETNGPYKNIFEFTTRLDLRSVNKKTLEGLALAGAFDSFKDVHRAQYFAEDDKKQSLIEKALRYGAAVKESKNSTQVSLFGDGDQVDIPEPMIQDCERWRTLEQLNREKEVVGVYISGHPLDDYRFEIEHFTNHTLDQLVNVDNLKGKEMRMAGIITTSAHLVSKTGAPYGKFTLEDYSGSYEFALFSEDYLRLKPYLTENYFVLVHAHVKSWFDKKENKEVNKLNIAKIELLSELRERNIKRVMVDIPLAEVKEELIVRIRTLAREQEGKIPLIITVHENGTRLEMPSRSLRVKFSRELSGQLEQWQEITWRFDKS